MSKVTTSIKTTTVPKAKTTKTTKAKVTTESKTVEAPVTAHITAPVTAPVTATVTAPVSTDVTEVPVSTEVTATDAQTTSLKMRFDTLIKSKQDLMNDIKREIQELRKMQRDHEHAVKDASKRSKKKKSC